jgi:hypothetical protein
VLHSLQRASTVSVAVDDADYNGAKRRAKEEIEGWFEESTFLFSSNLFLQFKSESAVEPEVAFVAVVAAVLVVVDDDPFSGVVAVTPVAAVPPVAGTQMAR